MIPAESAVETGFRETEIGPLPADWELKPLGELALVKYGKARPKSEGDIPVIGSSGVYAWAGTSLVDFSTIAIGRKGSAGQVWLITEPSWVSDTAFYLEWQTDVNVDYLAAYLDLYKLSGEHAKTTLPSLQKPDLESLFVALPSPSEQRRIAAVLNTIQDAIAAQDDLIAETQEFKRSLMQRLFTHGPGADPAETKETEIGEIPEYWEIVKLNKLVRSKVVDGVHKTPTYVDEGIPFISATNLRDGRIDFSNCKYISEEEHKKLVQRCKPEPGDILLSKVGTLGLVALIETDREFSIFVQVALVKPNQSISSSYLKHCLTSEPMQRQIVYRASQSTMLYIGVGKIAELEVPIPPLEEQVEIAQQLNYVDHKIAVEEDRKAALQAFFKTMLQQLMTGQIRMHSDIDLDL